MDVTDFMITNFGGTATEVINTWCRGGDCVNPDAEIIGANIDTTIDTLSKALDDDQTNNIVSQLAQDLTNTFGEDFSPLQSLTEMEHEERKQVVNQAIDQVAQDLASDDWLSGLLGVFSEGTKNDGLERKGDRRN